MASLGKLVLALLVLEGFAQDTCSQEDTVMLQVLKESNGSTEMNYEEMVRAYHKFFGLAAPSPETKKFYADIYKKEVEEEIQYRIIHNGTQRRLLRAAPANKGDCKSLLTWGSPGSGSPGLKRSDGSCFQGKRCYTITSTILGQRADPITFLPRAAWFYHPKMDAVKLHDTDSTESRIATCSDDVAKLPPWEYSQPWRFGLHLGAAYMNAIEKSQFEDIQTAFELAFDASYEQASPTKVQDSLVKLGWNVVGAAKFEGTVTEGTQVSYLLQDNSTADCILTFQGTDSWQDWWTDAAAFAVSFCGLTEQGDTCCSNPTGRCLGVCKPKGNGISFVHLGFRNQLQRITSTDSFQKNVRSNLQYCRTVSAMGHSLGGAMAELFTACADQYLIEGDYGYEDYSKMGWNKSTAKTLPARPSFT